MATASRRQPSASPTSTPASASAQSIGLPAGAVQTSNQESAIKSVAVDTAGNATMRSRLIASHAVAARPAASPTSSPGHASGQCRALTLGGRLSARYAAQGSATTAESATSLTSHRNTGLLDTSAAPGPSAAVLTSDMSCLLRDPGPLTGRIRHHDTILQRDSANLFCRHSLRYPRAMVTPGRQPSPSTSAERTELYKTLTNPVRRRILDYIGHHREANSTSVAKALGESTGTTSYHLRKLADLRLIEEIPERSAGR